MAFRVLSIDGGGMRGIYSAAYLSCLEKSFAAKRAVDALDIGKAFDLIVGTSTGAIIGCGLAAGVNPSKMVSLYKDNGSKIFPQKLPSIDTTSRLKLLKSLRDMYHFFKTRQGNLKKGNQALQEALDAIFQDTTIRQIWDEREIALAIPAVRMGDYSPHVFKTPHMLNSDFRDDGYRLSDICLASSAAPIYRSLAAVDHPSGQGYTAFADGGLWANNPVMVALMEALRIISENGEPDKQIEIFCLGSCSKPEGQVLDKSQVHRGLGEWKFGGEALNLSLSTQSHAFNNMATFFTGFLRNQVQLVCFPSGPLPCNMMEYLALDETRPIALNCLIEKGRSDAALANSEIQRKTKNGQALEALFNSMPVLPAEMT